MVLVVGVQLNLVCKGLDLQPKVPSEEPGLLLKKLVDSVGELPVVLPQDRLHSVGGAENKETLKLIDLQHNEVNLNVSDNG